MKLKSKLLLALLATSAASFANAADSELAYNVGAISQYRYRGIAQTKGDAALQGGADYTHASGFYAGAWGSTIKWIKETGLDPANNVDTKGPFELDLYGGYKFEAAGVAYDVGYLRYQYVNNTYNKLGANFSNANTDEIYGAASYGVLTAKYSYTLSDLFGQHANGGSKHSGYFDLTANFDLGNGYSFAPHAGRQTVANNASYSYTDYAVTLGKDLGKGLSANVAAISTTGKNNINFTTNGYNTAKNALVVGVKYTF